MKSLVFAIACLVPIAALGFTATQEGMPEMPKPTKEHQWLKKFTGQWTTEAKGSAGEGQPEAIVKGTIKSEMMGGFWLVNTMDANFNGTPFKGVQTIGYDVNKKKYVGTWIDTMNGFMWQYTGVVENDGTKLSLYADGPDMTTPGKTAKYRDSYEFKSDNDMIVTSAVKGADGKWMIFNRGVGKRTPKAAKPKK